MQEGFGTNSLEHEIEELSKEIDAKREILERERGIIEEKEVLRHIVGEKLGKTEVSVPAPVISETQTEKVPKSGSYLDTLDDDSKSKVDMLVSRVTDSGLTKTVEEAKKEEPYIIDAFHDFLVDFLYDTLKEKGLLN